MTCTTRHKFVLEPLINEISNFVPQQQECPGGSYCDLTETNTLSEVSGSCPMGRYCPPGTKEKDQFKCPERTFLDIEGQDHLDDCKNCTAGKMAKYGDTRDVLKYGIARDKPKYGITRDKPKYGLTRVTSKQGMLSTHTSSTGKYCAEAGLADVSGNCTAGFYCPEVNQTEVKTVEHQCAAGWYCPAGSKSAEGIECPVGAMCPTQSEKVSNYDHFCEIFSRFFSLAPPKLSLWAPSRVYKIFLLFQPIQCTGGQYQDEPNQAVCLDCILGKDCSSGKNAAECPRGSYCEDGVVSLSPPLSLPSLNILSP